MNNNYRVLGPKEFSGDIYGDFGYEIGGVKSEIGYVSRKGAENAMNRKIEKMAKAQNAQVGNLCLTD